jgi:outer membrane protein TolC
MLLAVVPLAVVVGCHQHCFMTENDYNHCRNVALSPLPACGDHGDVKASPLFAPVRTVLNPEGDKKPISLAECVALALENGRVGGTSIRVLAFDPAVAQTQIESALSRFDARWTSSLTWTRIDELTAVTSRNPVAIAAAVAQAEVNTALAGVAAPVMVNPFIKEDTAAFESTITKPLPTGGLAGITFRTDYNFNNLNLGAGGLAGGTGFNPTYQPRLVFNFEQPLLRDAGVEINQISGGILLARIGLEEARTRFVARVMDLLFQVETSYWGLYSAYWNLYTRDQALQQALDAWQIARSLGDAFRRNDVELLAQQYESFRLARLEALNGMLEAERQLRFTIGLPPEDGCRLVPLDEPTLAPYRPDWCTALNEALANRPELIELRQELKSLHLQVKRAKNLTLPDLRVIAQYDINGVGNQLDGNTSVDVGSGIIEPRNALRSLASNHFNDWTLGLRLDVPIGFRDAHAQVRRAELALAQRLLVLHDQEAQTAFTLEQSFRTLVLAQERLKVLAASRELAQHQYTARIGELREGVANFLQLLDAQRALVLSQIEERLSITQYNVALADFERQKGTLLAHDNVTISDGPLPACVEARASAHIRERNCARTLCERPADCGCDSCAQPCCGTCGAPGLPAAGPGQPLPQAAPAGKPAEALPMPAKPAEALPMPANPAEPKKTVSLDRPAATPLPVSRYPDLAPQR